MTATQTDYPVTLHGEQLVLMPERAIFWPDRATLVISDLHIGKAAAFRVAGVPVPELTTGAMLARLTAAIARTQAGTILCLGDLLHAASGRTPAALEAVRSWREQHRDLTFVLVRGNHDTHAGDPPHEWDMRCVDEPWTFGPFAWRHRPAVTPERYTFAGHVHPAAARNGMAASRSRLAATDACGGDDGVGWGRLDFRDQTMFAHFQGHGVMLGLIAKGAGHAAAGAVDLPHGISRRQRKARAGSSSYRRAHVDGSGRGTGPASGPAQNPT